MSTLDEYFQDFQLRAAWEVGPKVAFEAQEGPNPFKWGLRDDPELKTFGDLTGKDKGLALMQVLTMWKLMKRGPVIIKPSPELGRALMDTEIRMPVSEYRQPFEVMGVELPREVAGGFHPCLMVVWRPDTRVVCAWAMINTGLTYYLRIGTDLPTIEDRIALREGVEDETDYRILIQGGRLAINACLLAAHRDTEVLPLPKPVQRQREANNRALRRQAQQVYQEIRFRDLVIKPRPAGNVMAGFGRLPKQRRSGHWKNVAYGPRFSLHRWTWIDEYETRKDEAWPDQPPTILMS